MTSYPYGDPKYVSDWERLPVPPPFMFACEGCWQPLALLAVKIDADSGCFTEQVLLAKHLATAHADGVPAPHSRRCDLCPRYAERPEDAQRWAEHRARDLFLPESVARLL